MLKNKVSFLEKNARFENGTPGSHLSAGTPVSAIKAHGSHPERGSSPVRPGEEMHYRRHPSDRAGMISPQRVGGLSGPTSHEGVALAGINRKKEELERSLRSYRE